MPDFASPAALAARLADAGYLADEGLAMAGFLALRLHRPIFLEGDAGVGKTAFAAALARAAGLELIRLQCYEGLDASHALYDWDFPRQVLHLRAVEAAAHGSLRAETLEADLYDRRFLLARPLLQAVERAPCVLLVDEIDRADDEFEAYLLELLADAAVTVPELGRISADVPPIVVVTSNRTREVHDALKRRCLYHWVGHPTAEREAAILRLHLPGVGERLAAQVAAATARLRTLDLVKPPGVAEAVDWAAALGALSAESLTVEVAAATLGVVLKVREDVELVRAVWTDSSMIVELARAMGATPDRLLAFAAALDEVGVAHAYWVGRLTLCGSPEDVVRYDAIFNGTDGRVAAGGTPWQVRRLPERSLFRATMPPSAPSREGDPALAVRATDAEVLRHRDLATLSAAERAEAALLLARLAHVDVTRPGRRHRPAARGTVDRRRSVRAMLRAGGEPRPLLHARKAPRPRRLVLLVDVSGSMSPYADALLRLAHACTRHRPRWTETYALGTRLTRLTPAMRVRDVEAALREAGRAIPDWRGGTRLADAVTAFVRRDGHRGTARGAVVVICSDGWESGDSRDLARLGAVVAHVHRLAARTVWVSPHAARPGFAPSAGGLAAVLPHVDALVAGHTVAALVAVLEEVRRA